MKRTGLQQMLKLAGMLCRLFGTWRGRIVAAVNDSTSATQEQKEKLLALIEAVDTACAAIDLLKTVFE